jgi:hypothetical protein
MNEEARKFLLFLVISLTLRGFYLFLFSNCYSFDLANWNQVGDVLQAGGNPYHLTGALNWPPVWMQLVFLFKKISLGLHCTLNDLVRTFLILTESVLAGLLYATMIRFGEVKHAAKILILGLAMNPIAVFQVCQHCNFDVLVGFWILLALFMLLRFQEQHEAGFWLWACFALGLGGVTKVVPLCLAPLLLLSVRKLKFAEQMLGAALLLVPILLALSIVYVLTPADIETKVLGYRSTPGTFGLSGLFTIFGAHRLLEVWPLAFEIIYGVGWLALGVWLPTRETLDRRHFANIAAALLLAIPALGPGYGLQYIYWFLPLLVLLYAWGTRKTRLFLLLLYAAAAIPYTIAYGLNYKTYGAFLLDLIQNEKLLKWSAAISSPTAETLLGLPLWLLYTVFVVGVAAQTSGEILRDFKQGWRRHRLDS